MRLLTKETFKTFQTYLFDASGVIYTDHGLVPHVDSVIKNCQNHAKVFLVTNNSYYYPTYIKSKLESNNIVLSLDSIISSGDVKYDNDIVSLIKNKRVYLLGDHKSEQYFLDAGCKELTSTLETADVIMLAAFLKHFPISLIDEIVDHCLSHPDKQIICCNPDRYVVGKNGLHPVVGYYAEKIENQIGKSIIWFGKPFKNFSTIVKHHLQNVNVPLNKDICFFDDNIDNVIAMQQHLGISGCWVKQTGIGAYFDTINSLTTQQKPDYYIQSLGDFA